MNASEVSVVRLYFLRALYLLIGVAMGSEQWRLLIEYGTEVKLMHGVAFSMLCALSAMSLIGLRYPLQMLPILFYEMTWKTIWLVGIALRLWLQHRLDQDFMETLFACSLVVIMPPIIPWRYVIANYIRKPGDRWWGPRSAPAGKNARE